MNTNLRFRDLDLDDNTLAAVERAGYSHPTEIQGLAIPALLSGKDVLGTAQTGTGKTAAFVLPMFQRLKSVPHRGRRASALILTPTRELAVQISDSIRVYGKGSGLRAVAIFGGASRNRQIAELRSKVDIVVATPGRLMDLVADKHLSLDHISYLVLDEADRMLDMGFVPTIRQIVKMIPTERQTALFSATMPKAIQGLAQDFLYKPVRLRAQANTSRVERIAQSVMHIAQADKLSLLPWLIRERQMFRALVFTRTKHRARKVAKLLLKEGIPSDSIHGDKSQAARTRALKDFTSSKIQVLVATDVVSRGIDVDDITHVINFELPNEAETYVHRVGRTARAGAAGEAISLCDVEEIAYLRDIEKLVGTNLVVDAEQPHHKEPPQTKEHRPKKKGGHRRQTPPRSNRSSGQSNGKGRRRAASRSFAS